MTVAVLGALLNFVAIIVMVIDPLKILRKGPWITILNLAIADLISCVSGFCLWGMPFILSNFTEVADDHLYMKINYFFWGFGSSGSLLILTFFMVQIFAVTKFPLKSRHWFQTRKVVLVCIAIWLVSFPMGLSYLAHLYFPLMTASRIWITRIGILQVAVVAQVILNIQVIIEIIRSGNRVENAQNSKHKTLAKTVIILTLILFFTAIPYFTFRQMEFCARLGYFREDKTKAIINYLTYLYAPIAFLNFAVNPILYSLRLPDYRKTLLSIVCKSQRKNFSPKKTTSSKLTNMFSLRSQETSDTSREKT